MFSVARIAPWLRFAMQHLAGELRVSLSEYAYMYRKVERLSPLELPACDRATTIELTRACTVLGLPKTGVFAALQVLKINVARLVDGDVGRLVSMQCPCLRELEMTGVSSISAGVICNASLQRLVFRRVGFREGAQLEVAAPNLYYLALHNCGERSVPVTVTAPILAELIWNHEYAPGRHRIEEADRQIYRLVVTYGPNTFNSLLLGRFDAVDELCLNLSMPLVSARFLFDRSVDIITIRSCLLMEIVIDFFTASAVRDTSPKIPFTKPCYSLWVYLTIYTLQC
jgi:hypothetical protein